MNIHRKPKACCLLALAVVSLLGLTGCQTTYRDSYRSSSHPASSANSKILCWPLLISDGTLTNDQASAATKVVGDLFRNTLGERFVSAGDIQRQRPESFKDVEQTVKNCTAFSFHLSDRKKELAGLADATGCRYLLLPTFAHHDLSARSIYHVAYAIPLFYVVIYGNIPISIGSGIEHMPVYTVTVIDMLTAEIVASEIFAEREDAFTFDVDCVNNMAERMNLKEW